MPNKFLKTLTLPNRGADAGCVLRGVVRGNHGLRLRVLEPQPRGGAGPIRGRFVLLEAGDNRHADSLRGLEGQVTDAEEVLRVIRAAKQACLSVVNGKGLMPEC